MWKYLLFLPQYGHALSLIIERRIIQLDMLVTSKKRKLTLQRDEGALIWIASEDSFLSTSIYDLVLIYVCPFHHHHYHQGTFL